MVICGAYLLGASTKCYKILYISEVKCTSQTWRYSPTEVKLQLLLLSVALAAIQRASATPCMKVHTASASLASSISFAQEYLFSKMLLDCWLRESTWNHKASGTMRTKIVNVGHEPHPHQQMLYWGLTLLVLLLGVIPLASLCIASKSVWSDLAPWTCLPNGQITFPWNNNDYSWEVWNVDLLSTITLGFGEFPFGTAKWIDVWWDILIGRVGQLGVSFLTYRVFKRAMLHSMERIPISFEHFAAQAFEPISASTTWVLARDFVRPSRRQTKESQKCGRSWVTSSLIIACIYVLAFPTIMSAMSGYQAVSSSLVVRPDNNNLLNMTDLQPTLVIIMDGDRMGFPKAYPLIEASAFMDVFELCKRRNSSLMRSSLANLQMFCRY